jgi:heme oxygenase (mycobilin-producing)
MSVILINSFEVSSDQEDEFLAAWRAVADRLASAPGYRWTRLHRSVGPPARFRFVNVAGWESPEEFRAALSSEGLAPLLAGLSGFAANPALYEVVYEHHA